LPLWLSPSAVAWLGALLGAAALAVGGGFVWYEHREIQRRELQGTELMARVLEDHANRTFNTIDVTLAALSESVRVNATLDPIRMGPSLTQAQQGLPFLRSVSLLDGQGRVLASSVQANVDIVVDPQRVLMPAASAIDRLGDLVPGRDLVDARSRADSATLDNGPRSFLTLVRTVSGMPGPTMYLVAVLNPDFFANEYQLMLGDASRAAALVSLDGMLLSATESIELAPGRSVASHRFFVSFLPSRESGSFIGPGIDARAVVTAFRALRSRPVAVVVERDYASVRAEIRTMISWVAGACALALALISGLVLMAVRSLRGNALVRRALDNTRERVAASERDLRTLVQSVQELIFRTDAKGRILFVNGRWQQISGRDGATAIGHRLSELCLPAERRRVDALFTRDARGAVQSAMVQIRTVSGDVRTLEMSVAPMEADDGSLSAYAGFAIDVSDRQLARHKLEAQLDFTARLLEVSPTPLFVKDDRGRFLMVNRAWLDLMVLERDRVIGRTSSDLFGADAPMHEAHDLRLLHTEGQVRYENRLVRPDGEERDTVVTKVPFTQVDGTGGGIIGSIIDVTEFREAERTTREARDAAEGANRTKSEFIANISHELRTPLQSIIGFSELGASMALSVADQKEMFGDIHAGGQRMLTLVNGLLDVSKMDSTVGSLALQARDLIALAADVVKELKPLAAQRDVTMVLADAGTPVSADVDAFRMQQVLRNVLANAMRFSPAGSRIDIACVDLGSDGVEVTVRDHGPGIPPGELDAIFDAFVQSSRTRDGSGGTGLGLTICRKIMSAHGGSIHAANAADGGAIMRIRLPGCALPGDEPSVALPDVAEVG